MKKIILAAVAASLTLTASAGIAQNRRGPDGGRPLAKLIAGRVPGKPVSCISAQISNRLQIIDHTAVVYDSGRTLYVAKPRDPRTLNSDDILVINRFGSQLCKQDIIRTVDRTSGFMTGIVFPGRFHPLHPSLIAKRRGSWGRAASLDRDRARPAIARWPLPR